MKQQVVEALSDSDRAALQSMIPLAGALGAGTIFALFFGGRRRRTELVVFEIFAVAAVFACVATTAYFAIALLHQDEAIGTQDLTRTAAPLLIAAFLLIFISAVGRLEGAAERVLTLLPLAALGIFLAFALSELSWEVEPASTLTVAIAIIGVGVVFSLLVGVAWRWSARRRRERAQGELVALAGIGFESCERALGLAVPHDGEQREVRLAGWERKGRFYLDVDGSYRLAELVAERWDEVAAGRLGYPAGTLLLEVEAPTMARYLAGRRDVWAITFAPGNRGEERTRHQRTDQGLFDVTDLVRLD